MGRRVDAAGLSPGGVSGATAVSWTRALLAVHGVQLDDGDLARLAARGATLVTCPRSNRHVGVGDPAE